MTDPKDKAVALNETEERLKLALKASGLGIFDWFPMKGELLWDAQMCSIYGLSHRPSSYTYEYFFSVIHPDDKKYIHRNFSQLLDAENELSSFDVAYRIITSGKIRHIASHAIVFRNEKGLVNRIIGTVQDISAEKVTTEKINLQAKMLESISDAVISTDKEFKIIAWNQAAEKLYGWTEEEAKGKSVGELLPIEYLHQSKEEVIQEFMDKGYWKGKVTQINKHGKKLYIQGSISALQDRDGNFAGAIGINQNISEQHFAEQALINSEDRFRTIFNQQFQFMAILTPEGVVTDINDLPLQITKTTRDAFIGKYFWDAPVWKYLPESHDIIKKRVLESTKRQEPLLVEDKFHTSKGEARYLMSAYSAIRDAKGEVRYLLAQGTDITERKLAEEALQRTEKELSKLNYRFQISTQAAQIGIWDWDIKTNDLHWDLTTHTLFGLVSGQFNSKLESWLSLIHPDHQEQVRNKLTLSLERNLEFYTEFKIQRPDQSIRYLKATGSLQTDAAGMPERMIGIQWDITQEKEAELQKIRARKLELQNQELELFAYLASHDLQEPLRTVKSFVKLLKNNPRSNMNEKERTHLSFISQAAIRMSKQVKDLLDYSRIGGEKGSVLVDCESILLHAKNDLWAQIADTDATIENDPLPILKGYQLEMRLLFQNLISNALKFHKSGLPPHIHISVQQETGRWVFCVKDNGIGIDPEFIDKIFLIFQRLHPQEKYEGTGIGLAHCHKIVDLHGGKIWVESVPDEGSSFYFTIPFLD